MHINKTINPQILVKLYTKKKGNDRRTERKLAASAVTENIFHIFLFSHY